VLPDFWRSLMDRNDAPAARCTRDGDGTVMYTLPPEPVLASICSDATGMSVRCATCGPRRSREQRFARPTLAQIDGTSACA
jgi:hypothetical protein